MVLPLVRPSGQVRNFIEATDVLNARSLDASSAAALNIGTTNATTITIGRTGQEVQFPGTVTLLDSSTLTVNSGTVQFGDGDGDTITLGGAYDTAVDVVNIGTADASGDTDVNLRVDMGVAQDKGILFDRTADSESVLIVPDSDDAAANVATGAVRVNGAGAFQWYNGATWQTAGTSAGNSLDQAYDQGSSITADAGAVQISSAANDLLDLNLTGAYSAIDVNIADASGAAARGIKLTNADSTNSPAALEIVNSASKNAQAILFSGSYATLIEDATNSIAIKATGTAKSIGLNATGGVNLEADATSQFQIAPSAGTANIELSLTADASSATSGDSLVTLTSRVANPTTDTSEVRLIDEQAVQASDWASGYLVLSEYNASNEWDALYAALGDQEMSLVAALTYACGSGGVSTLQGAYDGGQSIVVDNAKGPVSISVANSISQNALTLVQSDTNNNPDALYIQNNTTGAAIELGGTGNRTLNSDGANLTVQTTSTGNLVLFSADDLDIDADNVTMDATTRIDIRAPLVNIEGTSSEIRIARNPVTQAVKIGFFESGTHTGSDNQSTLTDSTQAWDTNALVGLTIWNLTDDSSGTITANTATTITATLAGGTENDWDTGDEYKVDLGFGNSSTVEMFLQTADFRMEGDATWTMSRNSSDFIVQPNESGADYFKLTRTGTDALEADVALTQWVMINSGSIGLRAGSDSHYRVDGANLSLTTVGSGDIQIQPTDDLYFYADSCTMGLTNGAFAITGPSSGGSGAVTIDNDDASGDAIAIAGSGSHDITSTWNTAGTETTNLTVSNGGAGTAGLAISASAASSFQTTAANLTLGTLTSGTLLLASAGELTLNDQHLSAAIPISESGTTGLDAAFTATSIVGALNELKGGATDEYTSWYAQPDEDLTAGQPVTAYNSGTNGIISVADANDANKKYGLCGVCVTGATTASGDDAEIATTGVVDVTSNASETWSAGDAVYLDTNAGCATTTAPSTSGDVVQRLGWATGDSGATTSHEIVLAIGEPTLV